MAGVTDSIFPIKYVQKDEFFLKKITDKVCEKLAADRFDMNKSIQSDSSRFEQSIWLEEELIAALVRCNWELDDEILKTWILETIWSEPQSSK